MSSRRVTKSSSSRNKGVASKELKNREEKSDSYEGKKKITNLPSREKNTEEEVNLSEGGWGGGGGGGGGVGGGGGRGGLLGEASPLGGGSWGSIARGREKLRYLI